MNSHLIRMLGILPLVWLAAYEAPGQDVSITAFGLDVTIDESTDPATTSSTYRVAWTDPVATASEYRVVWTTNLVWPRSEWVDDQPALIPATGTTMSVQIPVPTECRFYGVTALKSYVPTSPPPSGMALIPPGLFMMGSPPEEGNPNELPMHAVMVGGFYMDTHEVTWGLWNQVYEWATNNGYGFADTASGKATDHPVQSVCWYDCIKWCNARSEFEGRTPVYYTNTVNSFSVFRNYDTGSDSQFTNVVLRVKWDANGYRLPSEAEWEKAARGGLSTNRFPWGDIITHAEANYNHDPNFPPAYDHSPPSESYHPAYTNGPEPYTCPVGSFPTNGYGLSEMAGNVWEWCWDWMGDYPTNDVQRDIHGPSSGSGRIIRGGNWYEGAELCRAAFRGDNDPAPGSEFYTIGFRTVISAGP